MGRITMPKAGRKAKDIHFSKAFNEFLIDRAASGVSNKTLDTGGKLWYNSFSNRARVFALGAVTSIWLELTTCTGESRWLALFIYAWIRSNCENEPTMLRATKH